MKLWGKRDEPTDPMAVRERSKAEVERLGGRTIDSLPTLERSSLRTGEDFASRTLVLNSLINLAYNAPVPAIRDWISANGLDGALSYNERSLLGKETEDLTDQERIDLSWSVEALHALLWAGGFVATLPIDGPVPDDLVSHLPNVERDETGRGFVQKARLRPEAELFAMLDLYYRAHWFARDGSLRGYDTGVFDAGVIMERRKALEWLLDRDADWDDISLDT